jgi:hypothetical protein
MKSIIGGALLGAAAGLTLATAASAAVTWTTSPGAPDPGPAAGQTHVITFDSGSPDPGVTITGDWRIRSGASSKAAPPAGDTTNYLTVPDLVRTAAATMDFSSFLGDKDVANFSFYWGSVDKNNKLELLDRGGSVIYTLLGSSLPASDGSQSNPASNVRIFFTLTGGDQDLGGVRFSSSNFAFETDTYAFNTIGVPEPASWAAMIVGFFGLGAMLRRRREGAIA